MKNRIKMKNILLVTVLAVTLLISSLVTIKRLESETSPVSLPVSYTQETGLTPLEQYRTERDEAAVQDMASLQLLCENELLNESTRENAAKQLQAMIDRRERQTALEGALVQSGVSPCVTIITEGCVTIVTEKKTLTEGEQALIVTLAGVHAGIEPGGVRVITGSGE